MTNEEHPSSHGAERSTPGATSADAGGKEDGGDDRFLSSSRLASRDLVLAPDQGTPDIPSPLNTKIRIYPVLFSLHVILRT